MKVWILLAITFGPVGTQSGIISPNDDAQLVRIIEHHEYDDLFVAVDTSTTGTGYLYATKESCEELAKKIRSTWERVKCVEFDISK